jgi:hypothetical protein
MIKFWYCKDCLRPGEDNQGTYAGIPIQYVCECGATNYTYIRIKSEEQYEKVIIGNGINEKRN